jgi:DNA-binding transcriptional MerR regulator
VHVNHRVDVHVNHRGRSTFRTPRSGGQGTAQPEGNAVTDPAGAKGAPQFTITELAREFDVTPRAIRFYEDMGLLEPARKGRNRVYSQRDRTRLKLVIRGKRLGFSLQHIRHLVTMYDTPSDTAPQLQAFLAALAEHRRQLELQLDDIRVTLAEIEQHENRCRGLLAALAPPPRRAAGRRASSL